MPRLTASSSAPRTPARRSEPDDRRAGLLPRHQSRSTRSARVSSLIATGVCPGVVGTPGTAPLPNRSQPRYGRSRSYLNGLRSPDSARHVQPDCPPDRLDPSPRHAQTAPTTGRNVGSPLDQEIEGSNPSSPAIRPNVKRPGGDSEGRPVGPSVEGQCSFQTKAIQGPRSGAYPSWPRTQARSVRTSDDGKRGRRQVLVPMMVTPSTAG